MGIEYNKLRRERAKKGLSISQLSELSKVSSKTIINIETNKTKAHPYILGRICLALNIAYEDLTELEGRQAIIAG